jgi:tetratricopeptide (TPR) repeat protein
MSELNRRRIMNKRFCFLVMAFSLAGLCAPLAAADKVRLVQGGQSNGRLIEMTPKQLVLESGSNKKSFAVNEVEFVQFESEPSELTQARVAIRGERYDEAVALLGKLDSADSKRAEIAADVDYYKALAAARLALSGYGSKQDAGRQLLNFEKAHKTSYHYYETCETLGDLLTALNRFDQAETFYNKLTDAPWPDYKMRAAVLVGRAAVSQKDYDRAVGKFDEALAADTSGKVAQRLKLAASLGKA